MAGFWNFVRWVFPSVFPAITAFVGVFAGGWLTIKRDRAQRRHDFVAMQLQDFYSPLFALRKEIRARSELRVRVHDIALQVWPRLCQEARERGDVDALGDLEEHRWPTFKKMTEYDNRQLVEELLPSYRKMIEIYRDKYWLADPASRVHFDTLIAFVEIWDRWLDKSLPAEVLEMIGHEEETLYPFYEHLQTKHDELRRMLAE